MQAFCPLMYCTYRKITRVHVISCKTSAAAVVIVSAALLAFTSALGPMQTAVTPPQSAVVDRPFYPGVIWLPMVGHGQISARYPPSSCSHTCKGNEAVHPFERRRAAGGLAPSRTLPSPLSR